VRGRWQADRVFVPGPDPRRRWHRERSAKGQLRAGATARHRRVRQCRALHAAVRGQRPVHEELFFLVRRSRRRLLQPGSGAGFEPTAQGVRRGCRRGRCRVVLPHCQRCAFPFRHGCFILRDADRRGRLASLPGPGGVRTGGTTPPGGGGFAGTSERHRDLNLSIARLRFQTSHLRFSLAFCALLFVICNAINFDKLSKWFRQGDGVDWPALSAYLVAGLCLFTFFFTLLAHRRTIKPLAILLTITSCAGTYFIAKYNVAVDTSMVQNTVHTDATEVGQLLSLQMLPYVVFLLALPVLIIWSADITFQPRGRYLLGSLQLIAVTLCV